MHDDNHGHSPAAWTGVAVMLVAAAAACWAAVFGPVEMLWIGLAVFLGGALLWYVLDRSGFGVQESDHRH